MSADWKKKGEELKGHSEGESWLQRILVPMWRVVGLPGFKTLVGSSFAWCGLFVAWTLYSTGHPIVGGAAGARNWGRYGQEISWRRDGIPEGAVIHVNHSGDCRSGKNNHVGLSQGDCAPADLAKDGAVVPIFGGNQSNQVKVSSFSVREICEVRWPPDVPLPPPVTVSRGCAGKPAANESTR